MELSGQPDALAAWAPEKNTVVFWIRGWVKPRVVLVVLEKRKISVPCRHSKSTLSSMYPSHHIACATPAPLHVSHFGVITISWKSLFHTEMLGHTSIIQSFLRACYDARMRDLRLWRRWILRLWSSGKSHCAVCLFIYFLLQHSCSTILPLPKTDKLRGEWRRWRNEELHDLYHSDYQNEKNKMDGACSTMRKRWIQGFGGKPERQRHLEDINVDRIILKLTFKK